ncbi:dephospho-CoA kinase [Crossiella equi]|uniref:Dephospho-CoA kinase n=2 Tax=Crossiella equi TaxID=130796 RepID=A0ABS5AMX3_9PSEU|nr:dephospho-CoA kinase [Crossiella equi]
MGSGKSTVAAHLAEHGAVVIDSDKIAREVVEPGTSGLAEIVEAFGEGVLAPDGSLDRAALASIVFSDEAKRLRLNAITHPRVRERSAAIMAGVPADGLVVHDIPLLVENGLAPGFHLVLIADAPVEERIRRLVTHRGIGEADARARIARQATDEQRRAAADVLLDNSGSPEQLRAVLDALWTDRLVPFEANVRLRRRADRPAPALTAYNPDWPARAERVLNRIRLVAGEKCVRADHIGSTAVPGLAAKDVLDLQLTVRSLADADALADQLGEAGFPVCPGITADNPKPEDPDQDRWLKRYHANADPGAPVNLHVRVDGLPNQRFALLFRDWLRAEPEPVAEYLELKQRVVAATVGIDSYADAKEPWMDKAYTRANDWAARTGWRPNA